MTTYIIVCVILFGISSAARALWLAFGGDETVSKRPGIVLDTIIVSFMFVWGLTLLLK